MSTPEEIKSAETDFRRWIAVCHKSGLTYWEILRICLKHAPGLMMQADAEFYRGDTDG